MKVKVSLDEAVKLKNAGLEVECYFVVDGEPPARERRKSQKRRRARSFVTRDNTTYRLTGKVPPYAKGSNIRIGLEGLMNLYKGGAQQRTRLQIDSYLQQHFAWSHRANMSMLSNLRQDGALEIVRI